MKIVEIDKATEGTFFRCLHDEETDNPQVSGLRRDWYAKTKPEGLRAKVLIDDNGDIVGLCQYLPIEHSPFEGKDLLAILCIWVHGYEHLVGNQQGKGYGRLFLEHIEEDASKSGKKGIVVWGKDFPYWNPISFYEHMGYSRVDKQGFDVLVWKIWDRPVEVPKIRRLTPPKPGPGEKVVVTALKACWCSDWINEFLMAQEALKGIEDIADYSVIDISSTPMLGSVLYLDDKPYKPDGPPSTVDELRQDIIKMYKEKSLKKVKRLEN